MVKNYLFVICLIFFGCSSNSDENSSSFIDDLPSINDSVVLEDSISVVDTAAVQTQRDSIRKDYEEDLSLEIKEIEEEKEDPITEECKLLLEDYAAAISSYSSILGKIEANQDNINLIIARSAQEEEMYSFSSDPSMFRCLQNPAFEKQVEILNSKRDKLISQ